jgi:putative oxidoreductase
VVWGGPAWRLYPESGIPLQRLFSTFPDGQPGVGLLLLRVGAAVPLIYFGIAGLTAADSPLRLLLRLVAIAGGVLLLVGLWTPIAGFMIALAELSTTLLPHILRQEDPWTAIILAVVSAGVALLGPGAFSIDARLFGRQLYEIDTRMRDR